MACFHGYGNRQDIYYTTLAMMNSMRFVCPSVYLSVLLSVCLFVRLSVSVYLSGPSITCLFVCLLVCLSI